MIQNMFPGARWCLPVLLLVAGWLAGALPAHARAEGLESLRQTGKAFSSVARKAAPSVVFIQVEERTSAGQAGMHDGWPFGDDLFRRFFGDDLPGLTRPSPRAPRQATSQGSGFVFAHRGDRAYLLTNHHVVEDAAAITVRLQDGREYPARIKGADAKSDVAVLEITARGVPALAWGDSSRLEVGEWVVALGNPFGLSHSLTAGVVSAKGRTSLGINDYEDFIQTDAAINPGNSGGPLLNLDGEVVGMNTAIFSKSGGYMGVGFAIPSHLVRNIAEQLLRSGQVVRGYIGLQVQPLSADLAEALDLRSVRGLLVNQVNPGSPAERAGIRPGDVLLGFAGQPLQDGGQYRNRAAQARPGEEVALSLWRDGRPLEVRVRVARLDEAALQGAEAARAVGLVVRALTPEEARRGRLDWGVVVTAVQAGSLAALAGLAPGTVILEVNRQPVAGPEEYAAALGNGDGQVLLRLLEQGRSRQLSLRWR